jgi:hypothetical protein
MNKITNLTQMEDKVLIALAEGMYAEYGFSDVGPSDLSKATGIPMNQLRGVLGSLSKKGHVYIEQRNDRADYRANDPAWEAIVYLQGTAEGLVPHWVSGGHVAPAFTAE